ncbi:EMI domain-containing protein 1 [Chelonia mydas]|uniref:EMI domain-containing protein 1 n=1 Tax=Chelonia mydas TaxID=8469 RepID=M7BQF4_CHEMY|nr:EMI domain-containing protein 1 [Chelonia mydas]
MSMPQLSWMRCLPAALWLCCLLPEGSCTWSLAGLQHANPSYRAIVRPAYKVAYKTVTALEWKCCPGHTGVNCKEGRKSRLNRTPAGCSELCELQGALGHCSPKELARIRTVPC